MSVLIRRTASLMSREAVPITTPIPAGFVRKETLVPSRVPASTRAPALPSAQAPALPALPSAPAPALPATITMIEIDSEEEEAEFLTKLQRTAGSHGGTSSRQHGWARGKQNMEIDPSVLPGRIMSVPPAAIDDSDDDSEDEKMPAAVLFGSVEGKLRWRAEQRNEQLPATASRGSATKVIGVDRAARLRLRSKLFSPSASQSDVLERLAIQWHRHLQTLLFSLGASDEKFSLYEHQFASALLCAGISGPWPTADLTSAEIHRLIAMPPSEERTAALAPYLPVPTPLAPGGRRSGCLLGDVMGLGKTVSACAGVLLREFVAILEGDPHREARSTLIVTPNDLLIDQWLQHLENAGIPRGQILHYGGDFTAARRAVGQASLRGRRKPRVVICSKYKLLTDIKGLFEYPGLSSPLAPLTTPATIEQLADMYDAKQQGGRKQDAKRLSVTAAAKDAKQPLPRTHPQSAIAKRPHDKKPAPPTDPGAPARVVGREARSYNPSVLPWLTVVIDEVHDLRNGFSYFGMGGLLACQQAQRAVLLSGTPFNNCTGDLVSIGAFLDATSLLATEMYYYERGDRRSGGSAEPKLGPTKSAFPAELFLRRGKDDLRVPLPVKTVNYREVVCSAAEIASYEPHEHALEKTLRRLVRWRSKRATTPTEVRRKRRWIFRLTRQFLAQAHPARMAVVHPVLPSERREVSRLFSLSRQRCATPKRSAASAAFCSCCHPAGFEWRDNGEDSDEDGDEEEEERREEAEDAEAIREGRTRRRPFDGDEDGDDHLEEEEEDVGTLDAKALRVDFIDVEDAAEEEAAAAAAAAAASSSSS